MTSQFPGVEDPRLLRINAGRFRMLFDALAGIGATPDGGVHRPAFGDAHLEARRLFLASARHAGLESVVDGAGNHSAVLRCGPEGAPTLLLGSHLDSVPYGGRFDGALGVAAALEVLQVVNEEGLQLRTHLEAIDFTDEEGHVSSFLGSRALTGQLQLEPDNGEGMPVPAGRSSLRPADTREGTAWRRTDDQAQDGGLEQVHKMLRRAGLSKASLQAAARDTKSLAGYLELHIEQGPHLAEGQVAIGIVTGIVGIRSMEIIFLGQADHAGTTPMDRRRDAALGASAFALAVRETVMERFPGCVATVGNMLFEPGAFNVVPQTVVVSLEFRSSHAAQLEEVEVALREAACAAARRFRLSLLFKQVDQAAPILTDPRLRQAVAEACGTLGLSYRFLPSGAGHDAQWLAKICPAGMIFVPSVGGHSHSAREYTEWQDCVNGANVLLQAALALAS